MSRPYKLPENNILGATMELSSTNRYLARDGLYYNGYALSSDAGKDYFRDACDAIVRHIEDDIGIAYDHGNGD